MGNCILIYSESGAGKTTSIRTLNHTETFIINIARKPLPFMGWKAKYPIFNGQHLDGRMANIDDPCSIQKTIKYVSEKRADIKNIVIDDWQYMSAFEFFNRADEKGFQKFVDIGKNIAHMIMQASGLREDLNVFFLTHAETVTDGDGNSKQKAKTIGKMIDEKLTLEGMFSIVLMSKIIKNEDGEIEYVFQTNGTGNDTTKSPMGMFESRYVPNDLQLVVDAIRQYEGGGEEEC